jgi:hypothetical protein
MLRVSGGSCRNVLGHLYFLKVEDQELSGKGNGGSIYCSPIVHWP